MAPKRIKLWVPLTAGFTMVLVLTAVATLVMLNRSFVIFDQLAGAYEKHYRAADALMHLRADLYLAGILKRDFLLDRTDNQDVGYGEQFAGIQASAESCLNTIDAAFAEHRSAIARLRTEVTTYMRPLRQALDWEPVLGRSLREYLLRIQVKQRTAAIKIADEIEKLNSDALVSQKQQIEAAENVFRQTLLSISTIGVLFGIAVAAVTAIYIRRLELQSDEAHSELRRLSQHVVRVQEYERKSISRELHDEIGQMLTGLRMELANLDGPALRQDPADYQRLQESKRLAERVLQCVRDLSMLLRPSMLDDLGLSPALQWQAREFSRRSGIPVDCSIDGDVDSVPEELRTCVYRVTQEALTNAARHANASRVGIELRRRGSMLTLSINDNGNGFSPDRPKSAHGFGLIGLKERVTELSGTVWIDSAPGKGTRIVASIPVQGAAA